MVIDKSKLYSKDEVIKLLDVCGATDRALDQVRSAYTDRIGYQPIWKYPFSDDMQGGGVIIPVQEGFLFLPYDTVFQHDGARYQLRSAELLTAAAIQTLQTECKSYTNGLLAVLGEMEAAVQSRSVKRYADAQGNIYFVRSGIGDVYKGFRRYAEPKKGQRRESGIRSLHYTDDFWQAQTELDLYAEKHHLHLIEN